MKINFKFNCVICLLVLKLRASYIFKVKHYKYTSVKHMSILSNEFAKIQFSKTGRQMEKRLELLKRTAIDNNHEQRKKPKKKTTK